MNVIALVNDTFRRDYLGCYETTGSGHQNLDRFVHLAAVFEQYYAASYPTVPNCWDMSTGRFGFPVVGWQPLNLADVYWAKVMSRQGVHTQMIWSTPTLGEHDYNYTRGFDGLYFVHGKKQDPWITNPSINLDLMTQPHKIRDIDRMENYLRNHHGRGEHDLQGKPGGELGRLYEVDHTMSATGGITPKAWARVSELKNLYSRRIYFRLYWISWNSMCRSTHTLPAGAICFSRRLGTVDRVSSRVGVQGIGSSWQGAGIETAGGSGDV